MGQGNEHVGVHNGTANFCFLHIFTALHGDGNVIGALEPVADENGTSYGQGCKTVLPGAFQMLQSVLPAAGIHGVAVGEEGLAAQRFYQIHHCAGVVGAEIADIAQLAEVELDGNEFAVHVDVFNAGFAHELLELGGQSVAKGLGAEVGIVYLCLFHGAFLLKW